MKSMKKANVIISLLAIICILFTACPSATINAKLYYPANDEGKAALATNEQVTVSHLDNKLITFAPTESKVGLIFYPGGSVDYQAYAPLMQSLAQKGIFCVLVHMPLSFAVFDMNAADGIKEKFPNIDKWYIGGHSLGGAMAGSYVAKHTNEYEGLILLAAYSTSDLSKSNLKVVSLYGSNDGVLDMKLYNKYKKNLPADMVEYVIDGGCHAYFGSYGSQSGDGTPTITNAEQRAITTDMIVKNIL